MKNESTVILEKEFISQQTGKDLLPLVHLKPGDIVELKNDGIYFTRKVDFGSSTADLTKQFEMFKEFNSEPLMAPLPIQYRKIKRIIYEEN